MRRIVLVSCASKKLSIKARARDLYDSLLFKLNLEYAESLEPDRVFILSAKHGLLGLEEEVKPYDKTLNKMPVRERREWADRVLKQLEIEADLDNDLIVFLAGKKYREFLVSRIARREVPLEGLGIGKQLKWLKEKTL